jgi:hypothetical protein
MTNGVGTTPQSDADRQNLQFDYAWKWFSYHADQRVKMFNFMLVVLGIFATAIVSAMGSGQVRHGLIAVLCFVAAGLALIFVLLDRRNRDLVWLGEEVLTHLEKKVIFGEGITIQDRKGQAIQFGILSRQSSEDQSRRNNLIGAWGRDLCDLFFPFKRRIDDAWSGRHRVWLPLVGILLFGLFLAAGIWNLKH